ncbi:MAG: formate/nitrite transporter family protein [Treponema sp.]|jgi:formate/nitrite transporter|nr:formate/nitrite transporter family protein [Treponema sp.]
MEILEHVSNAGLIKTQRKILSVLILAFLAGVYIAFASEGSNMAAYNLLANSDTYGLGRVLAGVVFGTGLMLVVLAGGELFTGNSLIIVPVLDRKASVRAMLLNWLLVYIGNFAGSLCIAFMMYKSGLFNSSNGLLGGMTIKIASYKTALPFLSAFFLGVMCNWLVCLAVWVSYGTAEIAGKALVIFFVICLFITSGFEHSVANMYYIPAGIFAKQNPQWLAMSQVPAVQIAGLNWLNFAVKNLIPVTLGNIAGGSGMVGLLYWLSREFQNKK